MRQRHLVLLLLSSVAAAAPLCGASASPRDPMRVDVRGHAADRSMRMSGSRSMRMSDARPRHGGYAAAAGVGLVAAGVAYGGIAADGGYAPGPAYGGYAPDGGYAAGDGYDGGYDARSVPGATERASAFGDPDYTPPGEGAEPARLYPSGDGRPYGGPLPEGTSPLGGALRASTEAGEVLAGGSEVSPDGGLTLLGYLRYPSLSYEGPYGGYGSRYGYGNAYGFGF